MTKAVIPFDQITGFRRGHRVRFANGPVMTVMNYTEGEFGEPLILCGWWRGDSEIEIEAFHPDTLIHTDADYGAFLAMPEKQNPEEFDEFHSG